MNSIYFFIFDCYYILIFICSIPAIYYINHNKPPSNYKFNKGLCLSLIIINFLLSIIPILFYYLSYLLLFYYTIIFALFQILKWSEKNRVRMDITYLIYRVL